MELNYHDYFSNSLQKGPPLCVRKERKKITIETRVINTEAVTQDLHSAPNSSNYSFLFASNGFSVYVGPQLY